MALSRAWTGLPGVIESRTTAATAARVPRASDFRMGGAVSEPTADPEQARCGDGEGTRDLVRGPVRLVDDGERPRQRDAGEREGQGESGRHAGGREPSGAAGRGRCDVRERGIAAPQPCLSHPGGDRESRSATAGPTAGMSGPGSAELRIAVPASVSRTGPIHWLPKASSRAAKRIAGPGVIAARRRRCPSCSVSRCPGHPGRAGGAGLGGHRPS